MKSEVSRPVAGAVVLLSLLAGAGCRAQSSPDPPIVLERNMFDQEKYTPQSVSHFFADRGTMRPLVDGVVPQEGFEDDEGISSGVLLDGSGYVMTIPPAVEARFGGATQMLERGRQRFDIYCTPCHGRTGDGKGMVARVPGGFPPLPTLMDPRIQKLPDGQIYATIKNGVRLMPPYGAQIQTSDRWAVVAYVRALEESQLAVLQGGPKK